MSSSLAEKTTNSQPTSGIQGLILNSRTSAMNSSDLALKWAIQSISLSKDKKIIHQEEIVQTSYSRVYQIKTNKQIVYLKQTPELLFLEPKMLTFLKAQGINQIPKLLNENRDLYCFLMTSCGDISLRELFKGKINLKLLNKGIANFINIQRLIENKIPELLNMGLPDWRLDKLPSLYAALMQQEDLLRKDGLMENEINLLHRLVKICTNLCESLAEYPLPETLSHCDFHDNNMLFDKKTKDINIIDWGETVIAHPFFSLNSCLWNLTYFYGIKETDSIYKNLQSACVQAWLNRYEEPQLLNLFNVANKLHGVYAALAYEYLYLATNNQPKSVKYPGSIAGCLRTFIHRNAKYSFNPLSHADLNLLCQWFNKPHVLEWWQDNLSSEEIKDKYCKRIGDPVVCPYIVYLNDQAIGFIQYYWASTVGDGWWPDEDENTVGLDQFIGEELFINKGYGTAMMKQFIEFLHILHPSIKKIITEASPNNLRAKHCYEKVGFKQIGLVDTPEGKSVLLELYF